MKGPLAVGGVGGSGTRVIAEILIRLGFYMGSDLNSANDNLSFTLLLKRPKWFIKTSVENKSEIFKALSIFEKAMTGCLTPKIKEFNFILRSTIEMAIKGHDHLHTGRGTWAIERAINILKFKNIDISSYIGWGWKEPNTHIFVDYLINYFSHMRYIHVVRNGLDMAYSSNHGQLFNWGRIFGLTLNAVTPLPKLSLQYWIKANERAINLAKELLKERFLLINFDRLCLSPEREIISLIDFLEIDTKDVQMDDLARIPKIPSSMGRYEKHDISIFTDQEISAVEKLGFEVHSVSK
jgi:hypothetical protein